MTPALLLGHGALAAGLALAAPFRSVRDRVARVAALAGIALAAVTVGRATGLTPWRAVTPAPDATAVAALAAAAAWLLVAARDLGNERWRAGVGVGIAGSGLLLFAGNRWVVPALLFWAMAGAALWVTLSTPAARVFSVVGGTAVVIAIAWPALGAGSWRAVPGEPWAHWTVVGAAVVSLALIPRLGPSAELGGRGACALPLLAGAGFLLALDLGRGPHPWLALALVALGAGAALWAATRRALDGTAIVSWPALVPLGLAYAAPELGARAAAAAILGITIVALWPDTVGRARIGRAATLSLLPPAVGFGAVVGVAGDAFGHAQAAATVAAGASWSAVAALLPLALAAGIVLGAAAARQRLTDDYEVPAVVATWSVLATVLGLGLSNVLPGTPGIRIGGELFGVALAAGLAAAYLARRHPPPPAPDASPPFDLAPVSVGRRAARVLTWVGAAVGAGGAVTVGWLTYRGLAVGFL